MVRENQRAWHAGCYNSRAIGYEHEGYASFVQPPAGPVRCVRRSFDGTSATRRGIPKAKRTAGPGILGHVDVTNCCCGTHRDPGGGWDWGYYIDRVNGTPPTPAWAATYVNQSYPSTMTAGSTAIVWAEFRNDGTGHWNTPKRSLGTSEPAGSLQPVLHALQLGGLQPPDRRGPVGRRPGAGRTLHLHPHRPATPGTYAEKYKLVREGVTWFGPEISWTITVTASQGNLTGHRHATPPPARPSRVRRST